MDRSAANGRMLAVEITFNKWLYKALVAREVIPFIAITFGFLADLRGAFTNSGESTAASRQNGRSGWICCTKRAVPGLR